MPRAAAGLFVIANSSFGYSWVSGSARTGQGPEADDGPDAFEHDEANLKWMERDPKQNRGPSSVQKVVGRTTGVDPSHLVAGIGNQNEERSGERNKLAGHVHNWLGF